MRLRLPSWEILLRRAADTAARFPLAIVTAFAGATAAWLAVDSPGNDLPIHVMGGAILGFSWLTAAYLIAERAAWTGWRRELLPLAVTALLASFVLAAERGPDDQTVFRFLNWALLGHLLVAVGPFLARGAGFWQFNRILFQRALLGALFTIALVAGLFLALAAVDRLLGISIHRHAYPRLLAVLVLVFNTWFVLAGIPRDRAELERLDEYPGGLRVFAQFVLVPLVTVYLVILTLYLGRVVVTRTWPSGWIGILVSGVAVAGMLGLLLLHPIRRRTEGAWVDRAVLVFHAGLVPALVMALLAVGKRIGQYGVTEPRYALAVLAGWLLLLALFFLVTRSRSIRVIPASLALTAMLAAVGPWGMFATARRSQTHRFRAILAGNGLEPGATVPDSGRALSAVDRRELEATLRYLDRVHGAEAVAAATGFPVADLGDGTPRSAARAALARMALAPEPWFDGPGPSWRSFAVAGHEASDSGVPIGGGSRFYPARDLFARPSFQLVAGADTVTFVADAVTGTIAIQRDRVTVAQAAIGTALEAFGDRTTAPTPLVVTAADRGLVFRFLVTGAQWTTATDGPRSVQATILIDRE